MLLFIYARLKIKLFVFAFVACGNYKKIQNKSTHQTTLQLMKVIPETRRTHLIRYLRVYCYPGSIPLLLAPIGIIRPVVNVSASAWFIIYIYYWNLQ